MLLRFTVKNHLSLRNEQELSLVASSLSDHEEPLIASRTDERMKILPCAVIYGPNASGKSNVVNALEFMADFVRRSHSSEEPGAEIRTRPFMLDKQSRKLPSGFETDFEKGEVRYNYGFEVTATKVLSEWLYAFPAKRRQMLFLRNEQDFKFGRSLKGQNRTISDLTRTNSLFISSAAQNGHPHLTEIYRFFTSMAFNSSISSDPVSVCWAILDSPVDERVLRFLSEVGTGITSYRRKKVDDGVVKYVHKIADALEDDFKERFRDRIQNLPDDLEFGHLSELGDEVFLPLQNESMGTRRLAILLSSVFSAIDAGRLLVIDELDASLHTQACEAIVGLFSDRKINKLGAQIVFTTHDTNLLNSRFLRRDEIWFCEKSDLGASILYPLSDIKVRKGDNFEKGYLDGRFGAVPFSGRIDRLLKGAAEV